MIGAPRREQRRRDERQQQVLDHVDREQGRVVARRSPTGARPRSRPARQERDRPPARHAGSPGGRGRSRRTSRSQPTAAASERQDDRPARTSSRGRGPATVGGSAGDAAVGERRRRRRRRAEPAPTSAASDGAARMHRGASSRDPARADRRADRRLVAAARRRGRSGVSWPPARPVSDAACRPAPISTSAAPPAPASRRHRFEDLSMSSTPGSRPSTTGDHRPARSPPSCRRRARVACVVVNAAVGRGAASSRRRPSRPSRASEIRDLYDIVFGIAVVIFFLVEGLIIWTRRPLPAQARRRRAPAADPRQQPRRDHLDRSSRRSSSLFLFVISWQTLNKVDAVNAQTDLKVRAVAGQFQWSFEYLPADDDPTTQAGLPRSPLPSRPGRRAGPAGRPDDPPLPAQPGRHPRLLRPAVPVQARRRPGRRQPVRLQDRRRPTPARPSAASAPSCAGSATGSMLFEVHALAPADFEAWFAKQVAAGQRDAAAGRRAARPPGRRVDLDGQGHQVRPGRP